MGMNGRVGRSRTLAGIRRRVRAEAAAQGIEVDDRHQLAAYEADRSKQILLGIADRARCHCGGPRHDRITAPPERPAGDTATA